MLPGELGARKLLVFSWQAAKVEPELSHALGRLPVDVLRVAPAGNASVAGLTSDPAVIACLLVVSRDALKDPSFPVVVQSCVSPLESRREFRLFVHLSDLTGPELIALAQGKTGPAAEAAANLIDSVHIGAASEAAQGRELVRSIETHLGALPEILKSLEFERWKQGVLGLVPLLNLAAMVLLAIAIWPVASRFQQPLEGDELLWALVALGALSYASILALFSLGSNLGTGSLLRWGIVFFPLWILNTISSAKLVAGWPALLAGLGAGFVLDEIRRLWAQSQREQIPIALPRDEQGGREPGPPGRRYWQMLTTAPVLGADVRIFISYSRSSPWGSTTASALHQELLAAGLSSFRDEEGIPAGTSWRHKIQEAVGRSTVFIALVDALTLDRHWPNAELKAAIKSQIYCGSPTLLLVRDPSSLGGGSPAAGSSRLAAVLSQSGEIDPTLLRIIDFRPDTPRHLALGLKGFQPASVVNPHLAGLLRLLLAPLRVTLAFLGTLGAPLAVVAALGWLVSSFFGISVEDWLAARELRFPCLLLAAFEMGFLIRLGFSGRYELHTAEAPGVAQIQLLGLLVLLWVAYKVSSGLDSLAFVFAGDALGLGFLLACDFISTALPLSGKYRPPPL